MRTSVCPLANWGLRSESLDALPSARRPTRRTGERNKWDEIGRGRDTRGNDDLRDTLSLVHSRVRTSRLSKTRASAIFLVLGGSREAAAVINSQRAIVH